MAVERSEEIRKVYGVDGKLKMITFPNGGGFLKLCERPRRKRSHQLSGISSATLVKDQVVRVDFGETGGKLELSPKPEGEEQTFNLVPDPDRNVM